MMDLKISLFMSSKALSYAHEDFYPNIRRIFIILLTLPITSVCCERSCWSLRRLKTWERATMGEETLCGLVTLHVHRENILRRFDETGHQKIGTLQFEWQFISSNHTYYMYRTLSYYSVEFISIFFFHWTHNHYISTWLPSFLSHEYHIKVVPYTTGG